MRAHTHRHGILICSVRCRAYVLTRMVLVGRHSTMGAFVTSLACFHMYMWVHIHVISFFRLHPLCGFLYSFLKQVLSLAWNLPCRLYWAILASTGIISTYCHLPFYLPRFWGFNLGLHLCKASTLLSFQPYNILPWVSTRNYFRYLKWAWCLVLPQNRVTILVACGKV